mmetsp:Transcript_27394/g.84525  ORF Transcript_27394/g.84525 Transcript_27394/m.84525 type:complete len:201 (-) Transcript_27394:297-899(-)
MSSRDCITMGMPWSFMFSIIFSVSNSVLSCASKEKSSRPFSFTGFRSLPHRDVRSRHTKPLKAFSVRSPRHSGTTTSSTSATSSSNNASHDRLTVAASRSHFRMSPPRCDRKTRRKFLPDARSFFESARHGAPVAADSSSDSTRSVYHNHSPASRRRLQTPSRMVVTSCSENDETCSFGAPGLPFFVVIGAAARFFSASL